MVLMKRLVACALLFKMRYAMAAVAHLCHAHLVEHSRILQSRIFAGVTCHIVESLGFETASGEILRELLEISPVNIVHNPVGAINQSRRETIVFPFRRLNDSVASS